MIDTMSYTAKDLETDQDVRWCPSCGDFAILKQVQTVIPKFKIPRENIVFISGIGCSSRFPYYMNTYGMHSIHGRGAAIATGLKVARPELSVWMVTGDGDSLSIGGNHFIHLLRRNPDINVLLFNNQIYGLTKGQYSPTSELHKVTKSTPFGSVDHPFNPLALALGADATFIARTMDKEAKHLQQMIERSHVHKGTSMLEIYQNCNIFNDNAFDELSARNTRKAKAIFVEHGQPLIFGQEDELGIKLDGHKPMVVSLKDVSTDDLWVHDENDLMKAQILVRFFADRPGMPDLPRVFGVLYQEERSTYEQDVTQQLAEVVETKGKGNLNDLLRGREFWTV
jgi:2-oxoglutarate ferredoxin oxidoreductase subunit beta